MNVYRHRNGGGLKVFPAQASPDSLLDADTVIEGESEVYDSTLRQTALKDSFVARLCFVHESAVADSRLVTSTVTNSEVSSSSVVGAYVEGSRLSGCRVASDGASLPFLSGVRLSGVTVSGEVSLVGPWGLELPGAHIHAGLWHEPPQFRSIDGEGVHVALVECTEGRAHMGCACRPVAHWLDRGPKLGRRMGWSEEMIETCRTFLQSLA